MLRLVKAIVIPVACVAALLGAVYLVLEADRRWERQRLEKRQVLGSSWLQQERDADFDAVNLTDSAVVAPENDETASSESLEDASAYAANVGPELRGDGELPVLDSWENNGRSPPPLLQLDRPSSQFSASNEVAAGRELLSPEEIQRRLRLATVRISHPELGPLGGGVVVGRSRTGFEVLTAQHVIDGVETIKITTFHPSEKPGGEWGERNYTARGAVRSDSLTDLALIRVNSVLQPEMQLDVAPHSDDLTEVAWALAGSVDSIPASEQVVLGGRQQARRHFDSPPVSYWRVMRPSEHGTSGSGLVDEYGHLLGIASGNSSGMAFYSDDREIRKFLGK